MKIVKRILFGIGILLVLLITGLAIVSYIVLTPERITPVVLKIANEQLNADIHFEELDVTIFSTFPNMGIKLKNGSIVRRNDTLLSFVTCRILFRPLIYIQEKRISITTIEIERPRIYAHINQSGQNNWDILPADTTTIREVTPKNDSAGRFLPDFGIRKLQLTDAQIIYNDNQQQELLSIDGLQLTLAARQRKDTTSLKLEMSISKLNFQHKGKQLFPSIPVTLSTQLKLNNQTRNLQIRQTALTIATLDFDLSGQLQWDNITGAMDINTDFSLKTPTIADMQEKIASVVPAVAFLKTSGAITVKGAINGTLSDKSFPVIDAEIKLSEGQIRSALNPNRPFVELLEINGVTHIDINRKTPSTLHLKRFIFATPSSKLDISGMVNHLFTDPQINAKLNANINFTKLSKELMLIDSAKMQGYIRSNLTGEFTLSHLLNKDIGKIKINGEIDVDSLLFDYPKQSLYVSAPLVHGVFGTNSSDSIRGRLRESLLRGRVNADNFAMKWTDMQANVRSLSAVFSTSAPADNISVAPVYTNLRLTALTYTIPSDSLRLRTALAVGSVRIAPQPEDPTKPLYNVRLSLDTLRMRIPEVSVMLNQGKLSGQVKERIARRPAGSTGRANSRRDSTSRTRSNENIMDMRLESEEARDLLRKWDIKCNLECKTLRVRTPFFPLRTRISEGILEFDTDTLRLRDVAMKTGKSAMQVNGSITGIRQALLRNGKLSADMHLAADTLDVNEITIALVAASKYSELKTADKQQLLQDLDKSDDIPKSDTTTAGVFIIPRNIDLKIRTNVKHVLYSRMTIDNLNSDLFIRNHTLEMPDTKLQSNFGDMQLSLVYQAMNTKGAHIGLDMDLRQIQIQQLISSFPVLDTLTPMLRSFEGVVDCDMTAVTDLDSLMNVIFPTATAACFLQGKDLVLMDGETFASIAKTLYFKNKKRNLIDSLSVEIIMDDNHLLIFPFLLGIDRYQVAIGGTQRLDLGFDYHITVIKSPIPFKFGLNINGTPDKYKIRVAKAKYSDLFKPVKTTSLVNTTLNVRQLFQNKLRANIQDIIAQAASQQELPRIRQQQQNEVLKNTEIQRLLVTDESEIVSDSTAVIVDETEVQPHSQQDSNLRPN